MELLHADRGFSLFNTVHDISIWTEADIKVGSIFHMMCILHSFYTNMYCSARAGTSIIAYLFFNKELPITIIVIIVLFCLKNCNEIILVSCHTSNYTHNFNS